MLEEICHIAVDMHLLFNPQNVMMDFEQAAMQAFLAIFPQVQIKFCLFHFGQSLWRKFQSLGLQSAYNNNNDFQKWARLLFSLSLVPLEKIDDLWVGHIMSDAPLDVSFVVF